MPVSSDTCAFQASAGRVEREVEAERAVVARDDLLLRDLDRHAAALALAREPQLAHLAEQQEGVAGVVPGGTSVDPGLRLVVGEALRRAHDGAPHPRVEDLAAGVEHDAPGRGRAVLARQEAGRALGQHGRVQRGAAVGRVEGRAALVDLGVDRAARHDERADVGDRVAHDERGAHRVARRSPGPLEVQRLVEVHRARRVDRDERDVAQVDAPRTGHRAVLAHDLLGLGEHPVREALRYLHLAAQRRERVGDQRGGARGGGLGSREAQVTGGHEPDPTHPSPGTSCVAGRTTTDGASARARASD